MATLGELLGEDMPDIGENSAFIEEIRIRRGCPPVIRMNGRCRICGRAVSPAAFDAIIDRACSHSFHAHEATLRRGYINAGSGIRVGVAGRAVTERGEIVNITAPECITIRLPHLIRGVCTRLFEHIVRDGYKCSALVYSPPGTGKTTLLRDIAMRLAEPPAYMRTVLIDSRQELYIDGMDRLPLLCVYSSYPKSAALEAAVRTMSPDFIISDEIGSAEEAQAILGFQGCGVSLIASAHGSDLACLLSRPQMLTLHKAHAFDIYCGITRAAGKKSYGYNIQSWEEVNKCLNTPVCV